MIGDTANLSDLARIMITRYGQDHPLSRLAVSQARHAGVITEGIEPVRPVDAWGQSDILWPRPTPGIFPYRDATGALVGSRAVIRT